MISSVTRILLLSMILTASVAAQSTTQSGTSTANNPILAQLRADLALHLYEAGPHMALAKYYIEHGNRLMAFYLLEDARRGRVPEAEFNQAFLKFFGGGSPLVNSKTAEDALLRQYQANTGSIDIVRRLADLYISRDDYQTAKPFLAILIEKQPDDFDNTAALGEVLRREKKLVESQSLLTEFSRKYPESRGAFIVTLQPLFEKDPEKAKSILLIAVRKFPNDGQFAFQLGGLLQEENKSEEAEKYYVEAARLSPLSSQIQAWVGRFFLKVKSDNERAMQYYLNAYLLDPNAYETEYVESRIRKLNWDAGIAKYEKLSEAGARPEDILNDPNPVIVDAAINAISDKWDKQYQDLMIKMMEHDDIGLRWAATNALMKNVDRTFDTRLKMLLQDTDLRKRGLAAYIAVKLWGPESFDYMRQMLKENVLLLRSDALCALFLVGGPEGRKIALDHRKNETSPRLIELIDSMKDK